MIQLFHGTDFKRRRQAAEEVLALARIESPGLEVFQFSSDDYSREKLEEAFLSQNLFAGRLAVVLENLWSVEQEWLNEKLSAAADSENLFIFLETENDLASAVLEVGGEVREFKRPQSGSPAVNLFRLADAVGDRERRRAWLLFQEALWRGEAAEEIFWKIVWKVKTLLLVKTAGPGEEVGLKPYPLARAKEQSRHFELAELENLSTRLVALWHDSRRGLIDFETNLERLILGL